MSDKSISEEPQFRVVFLHEFDKDATVEDVREKVISRFKLSNRGAAHVFAGRPIVIKRDVDVETAFLLKLKLGEIGAHSCVETMPQTSDTDAFGYVERRRGEQRQRKDRRALSRDMQFIPERRQEERRASVSTEDREVASR